MVDNGLAYLKTEVLVDSGVFAMAVATGGCQSIVLVRSVLEGPLPAILIAAAVLKPGSDGHLQCWNDDEENIEGD